MLSRKRQKRVVHFLEDVSRRCRPMLMRRWNGVQGTSTDLTREHVACQQAFEVSHGFDERTP